MQFTSTQENFTHALQTVCRISQKHTSLPILENVLIRADASKIEIMGTNLEIGIQHSFRGKVEVSGEITVPAKVISGFISHIPSENQIVFTVNEQDVSITSGKYKANIKGIVSEDFPLIPQPKENEGKTWNIPCKEFQEKITQSMMCVAPNDVRVEFSGVYAKFSPQGLTLVSTDSFRLLEVEYKGSTNGSEEEVDVIIPLRTLTEVIHCLPYALNGLLKIHIEDGQIFFILSEDVIIVSQLISGNFPDYKQIIPKSPQTILDLNTKDCMRAVKLAHVFSQKTASEVIFRVLVESKQVLMESKGGAIGKNTTVLDPIFIQGVDQEVILNPKYISDVLHLISEDEFRVAFTNDTSPVLFGIKEGEQNFKKGFCYVLMPIKK